MKCSIKQIKPWPIYHFSFDSQYEMTSTFIRIQECNTIKFKNIHFSVEDCLDWWYQKFGISDYFDKWDGFSIHSDLILDFKRLFKDKIRDKEKWFFEKIDRIKDDEYSIVTTHGTNKEILYHEVRHSLFYLYPIYAAEVVNTIRKYKIKRFRSALLNDGYQESEINNEINAYAVSNWMEIKENKEMKKLKSELYKIERKHFDGMPRKILA